MGTLAGVATGGEQRLHPVLCFSSAALPHWDTLLEAQPYMIYVIPAQEASPSLLKECVYVAGVIFYSQVHM